MDDESFTSVAGSILRLEFERIEQLREYLEECFAYCPAAAICSIAQFEIESTLHQKATKQQEAIYRLIFGKKCRREIIVSTTVLTILQYIRKQAGEQAFLSYAVGIQLSKESVCAYVQSSQLSTAQFLYSIAVNLDSVSGNVRPAQEVLEEFQQLLYPINKSSALGAIDVIFSELRFRDYAFSVMRSGQEALEAVVFAEDEEHTMTQLVLLANNFLGMEEKSCLKAVAIFERLFEELIISTRNNDFLDIRAFATYRILQKMISRKRQLTFRQSMLMLRVCIGECVSLEDALTYVYGCKHDKDLLTAPPRALFALEDFVPKKEAKFIRYFCNAASGTRQLFENLCSEVFFTFYNKANAVTATKQDSWIYYPPAQISIVDAGKGVPAARYGPYFEKCGVPITSFVHCVSPTFMNIYGDSGIEAGLEDLILYGKQRKCQLISIDCEYV